MGLALAFGAGVALVHLGTPLPPTPLLLLALLVPILAFPRPGAPPGPTASAQPAAPGGTQRAAAETTRWSGARGRPTALLGAALAAGVLHGLAWERGRRADCRLALGDGQALAVVGRVESATARGRVTLAVQDGLGAACRRSVRVVLPAEARRELAQGRGAPPRAGDRLRVEGRWRRLSPGPSAPEYAGELVADDVGAVDGLDHGGRLLRRRASLEDRLRRLYPERHGVVSALILARREGLDPGLRQAFARSGTAHLLAISGFHVGVVGALLLGLARTLGAAPRPAGALAAVAVWGYVLFIGAPDAAARAALILTLFAAGALRGRPLSRPGALATAFLAMVAYDAGALARPGFQLSFSGVLGLVMTAGPLEVRLRRLLPGGRLRSFRSALAAGIAATLFTLPVVAWHFDQVSLVGIPATLMSTPLVAAAIPGAFSSLVADAVHPAAGAFVAGGTDLLLSLLLHLTVALSDLPRAVAWVPRAWILAGATGAGLALGLLAGARRMGPAVRGAVAGAGALCAVLLLPAGERVAARGTVELLFLDVGQGDAILIRSPGARWVLVDAGPPAGFASRGDPAVLAELRRRGVRRLEAMMLSHPHLDHIGGAAPVLREFPVGVVVDPGMARGTEAFLDVLRAAEAAGRGWRAARRGDHLQLDGVDLRVLHSLRDDTLPSDAGDVVNESSVVVLLSFGAFSALLTGDAPVEVEEAAIGASGPVDLLKVGHHGSRTSTSARFLEEARAGLAVISVGTGNRYGHPHEPVVSRLLDHGLDVYRTDLDGTVRVLARRDGTYTVRAGKGR